MLPQSLVCVAGLNAEYPRHDLLPARELPFLVPLYPLQCGIPVRVLERASGLRAEGAAIGLWSNAWRALDALDARAADTLRGEALQLNK